MILKAPAARRDELRALVAESQGKIAAFFRGQLILCSIIGLASTIAYLLLGIPNAFLLGLLMALFESVPLVGPFLGAIPALIVTMSSAPDKVVWVIGALVLIQVLESNLLVPRVMDRSVGVNAIITMLALAAFGALFGLLGALLAVPLAAILQIVVGRILFNAPINEETTPAAPVGADVGRSRIGVLRLEAQNLVHAVRKQAAQLRGEAARLSKTRPSRPRTTLRRLRPNSTRCFRLPRPRRTARTVQRSTGEQAGDLVIESAPARGSTGGSGATARRLP